MKNPLTMTLSLTAATLLAASSANAALITGVTIQDFDGTVPNGNMTASDAIDGNGLPSNTPALSGTHTTTWNQHWFSSLTEGFFTVDLEANYSIDTIHIWNENENNPGRLRGLKNAEIWVASVEDSGQLVKLNTDGTGTQDNGSGDFLFPIGEGVSTYTGFDLDLSGVTNASLLENVRLVRIQAIDVHGATSGSGLAEIQFGGGAPVPEPGSLALLGLGGLLIGRRRRA